MFCGAATEELGVLAPVNIQLMEEPGENVWANEKLKLWLLKHWSTWGVMTTGGFGFTVSCKVTVLSQPLIVWNVIG